ncbi:DNA replication protein [Gallibacterium genomosp. 3]|uniref:DNA replication protein n=1 Tax=Gallibacterium genomosp. 3 TaxID=505345 RepID=A0A1A7NNJ1_9PAST|nr:DnaA inactivator Hda [Gallibacterium genomosp. 3]OBW91180.1 DNA replication protein [Gallibacterium genomosp. 3]
MQHQYTLPIHEFDPETFDNFDAENNQVLCNSLFDNFSKLQQPFFYLWGTKSSGKTHILKAANNLFLQQERASIYIPLTKTNYFSPEILESLEELDLVCLDDLDAIAGNDEWEVAIFDLFNRIKERSQTLLLMSANEPAQQLAINLPDLRSRLTWGETYQLAELSDEKKAFVLQQAARKRGLELPDEVAKFLLNRLDRDLTYLFSILDKLDKASLQAQRKLTIPFVKEQLHL